MNNLLEAKRRLYMELLYIPTDDLTESDLRFMDCLIRDPQIQDLFDRALKKEDK